MAINPNPVTVWTRETPNDGLLFQSEFARLYSNDQDLETQIANVEVDVLKQSIELSKKIGEYFFLPRQENEAVWNPSTPETYNPAICLTKIDVNRDVAVANFPDFVPYLRAIQIKYREGKSDEVTSWAATVSGSIVTMPNNTSSNRLLLALAKWVLARGSYATWITITIAGVEYVITNINTVTREITVSGTPATGAQTATFFPHRIAGSTTTARVHEVSGKTLMAGGDAAGLFITGLQCLGYFQGHDRYTGLSMQNNAPFIYGQTLEAPGIATSIVAATTGTGDRQAITSPPRNNGTDGAPRTSSETHGPALLVEIHQWTRRYLVP